MITCFIVSLFRVVFFNRYRDHRALLSFPTRRSSDLAVQHVVAYLLGGEVRVAVRRLGARGRGRVAVRLAQVGGAGAGRAVGTERSEEHTSELQSREKLGCRLLPEKKKHTELPVHSQT